MSPLWTNLHLPWQRQVVQAIAIASNSDIARRTFAGNRSLGGKLTDWRGHNPIQVER